MKTLIATSLVTTLLIFGSLPALADHGENFHCDRIPFLHERAVKSIDNISHNRTMSVIVKEYAQQWEAEEIRRTCKAASAGKPADFSCFQGRRDWDAIEAKVPDELFTLDVTALRPHQLRLQKLRAETRPYEEAFKFCEKLGVIER